MTNEIKVLLGIGILTVAILIGGVFFLGKSPTDDKTAETVVDQKLLLSDDAYSIGSASAKVTIVEFGDYQCPACASAVPIIDRIINDYKENVRFVFRHFPLTQHKNAKLAALVAESSGKQNKYFDMHTLLYANQSEWAESRTPMTFFERYAKELKLDIEKLKEDIKLDSLDKKIDSDLQAGLTLGINSTPTFFVNGKMQKGIPQYSDLQRMIEDEIKS